MPLVNFYADPYLAPLVTVERESRAAADVAQLGTLPADWVVRLVILRAYVLTCIEMMKAAGDLFDAKGSHYGKAYAAALIDAREAQRVIDAAAGASTASGGVFVINFDRG